MENQQARPSRALVWQVRILWVLALVALGINVVWFLGILRVRSLVQAELTQTAAVLNGVTLPDLDIPVDIDTTIPVSFTVAYQDVVMVPIDDSVPVSTTILFQDRIQVPINHIVQIDNSIEVDVTIPVINQQVRLPIPISTNIPVVMDVEVPISQTVPVSMTIPVQLNVEVPIDALIPVSQTIPIALDVPVDVPISELGVEAIFDDLSQAILDAVARIGDWRQLWQAGP